jgi:hypothetical protein
MSLYRKTTYHKGGHMKTMGFMCKGMAVSSVSLLCVCIMLLIGTVMVFPGSITGEEKANKPMVKGSLIFEKTTVNFNDVVAVSGNFDGVSKTIVYLTDKLGDRNEAVKGLLKNGSYGGPSLSNRLELTFNPKGDLKYYFFYVRQGTTDRNVGKAPEDIKSETTISKGRAKGHVFVEKPLEVFEKKYKFDVTFDVDIISK